MVFHVAGYVLIVIASLSASTPCKYLQLRVYLLDGRSFLTPYAALSLLLLTFVITTFHSFVLPISVALSVVASLLISSRDFTRVCFKNNSVTDNFIEATRYSVVKFVARKYWVAFSFYIIASLSKNVLSSFVPVLAIFHPFQPQHIIN